MLKCNLERQLQQLHRLDPAAGKSAQLAFDRGWYDLAQMKTVDALGRILGNQEEPEFARLWAALVRTVERGITPRGEHLGPATKGRQVQLGRFKGRQVYLYCATPGTYRLTRRYEGVSGPVVFWGRDETAISAPQTGCWKLTTEARKNFRKWVDASGESARWHKEGGVEWQVKTRLETW